MALSTNLGFPRIGKNREFKRLIESFWQGKTAENDFTRDLEAIQTQNLSLQIESGLDLVPLGDFSAYDLMLETALMFSVVPQRFQGLARWKLYYAMARGTQETTPCEMKKWFDSNYHYIMPEIDGDFKLATNRLKELYLWATQKFSKTKFKPVLIGPYTFLKLSKIQNQKTFEKNLEELSSVYARLIGELATTSCEWLQIDEPALCLDTTQEDLTLLAKTYETLTRDKKNLKIILQTYFGDVTSIYDALLNLPVEGLGFDFVRGPKTLETVLSKKWPSEKWLGAGLIDGRNVWRSHLGTTLEQLTTLANHVGTNRLWIHPSSSLLHLPLSLEGEKHIPCVLKKRLSFALERLEELVLLTKGVNQGAPAIQAELKTNEVIWNDPEFNSFAFSKEIQDQLKNLKTDDFQRALSFEKRSVLQQKHLNLPPLPTTTIGSFPQTSEIRQARALWKKGELSQSDYEKFIAAEMKKVVDLQEEIGLDVLVHGEPERTDMVEYFAEQMNGFQFTQNGWVQSYGTRCVRAPIIYGDVSRQKPMTVKEAKIAQSFTKKPMKGMLTGPVTILNWSFPRVDCTKKITALQIALALREEVLDLEKNGIQIIQIDEPALREGLPLKKEGWKEYLDWAVAAFKLSSSAVKETTQIHTHMCYSEFADILEAIQALDADSLSIEDSRSHGRLAKGLSEMHYKNGIGPGVYDVHSERVPPEEEFEKITRFLAKHIPLKQLWINPDCGLKTRGYKEVIPALKNMVSAVKSVRKSLEE